MNESASNKAITKHDDLYAIFEAACKPALAWRVGMESEKFGLGPGCTPVHFTGPRSISTIFERLVELYGWKPVRERADGPIIALSKKNAHISLEPGNQLELSGAPFRTIHELALEVSQHRSQLESVSKDLGLAWYSQGFHPFATRLQVPTNPKARYDIMRSYLPTRGTRALDMMLRTCTVQANFDFDTIEDALRKMRLALKIQPIVTAMFANSPVAEGQDRGKVSLRAEVWLDTDRARTGLLPQLWNERSTLDDYVRWALEIPMFFVKRGERILHNTGQTFSAFMKQGFEGERATLGDWELHLSTIFPEVRLKKTIEVRGADAPPLSLYLAIPAFWKGLLYDPRALDAALELVEPLQHDAVERARPEIIAHGLKANLGGRIVLEWAQRLASLARTGLDRAGLHDGEGNYEVIFIQPLIDMLAQGHCPADIFRAALQGKKTLGCDDAALQLNRFC